MPTIAANDSRLTWSGPLSLEDRTGLGQALAHSPWGFGPCTSPRESGLAERAENAFGRARALGHRRRGIGRQL